MINMEMEDLEIIGLDDEYEEEDLEYNRFIWKRIEINRGLTKDEEAFFGRKDLYLKGVRNLNRPIEFASEPKDKNLLIGYSELKHYIKFGILKNLQTSSKQEELDSQIKSIKNALNEINNLRKNG